MSNWKERLAQFMQGRYGGNDTLNKWLLGAFFVLLIIALLIGSNILNLLSLVLLIWAYYRILSKNTERRALENQKFLEITKPIQNIFHSNQNKTHHIYTCPQCKQRVRVPKGRGKICITCPKCRHQFVKRS